MSFPKRFARQSRTLIVAEALALLGVTAVLDLMTSYRIRLLPFYAVPIFVLSWFCGKAWGIASGAFSALSWWCANWFTGDPDLRNWIGVWEVSRHVSFFLIVALVLFLFIVKFLGWVMRAKKAEAAALPPPTRQEELLTEIRDLLKQQRA